MNKKTFATQLTAGFQRHYAGRLPSFSVIARDFTLRAPGLAPVSSETVRHWIRGESMPHVSRMQILIEWLGNDLADCALHRSHNCCNKGLGKECHTDTMSLCDMIERLDPQESLAVKAILRALSESHSAEHASKPL